MKLGISPPMLAARHIELRSAPPLLAAGRMKLMD
jgi:hypothetical protein